MSRQRQAELALAGVTLLWGATFTLIKGALDYSSTFAFLAMRFLLASAVLVLIFGRSFRAPGPGRSAGIKGGALAGCFLFLAYVFQTEGLRSSTPSKSAFITGLSVVLVPFFSVFVYRIAPRPMEVAGVAAASIGLAMLTLPSGRMVMGTGDLLTVCCAIMFAFHILTVGWFVRRSEPGVLSVTQIGVTALLALAACGWAEPVHVEWRPELAWAIVVSGLLATALAFTVQVWAQQYASSTRAALIFSLEPAAAAAVSYLVSGEMLRGRALAGAGLILAGVLLAEMKPALFRRRSAH